MDREPAPTADLPALVALAQGGDRSAFDVLVTASRDSLARIVGARLGNHLRTTLSADEVVHETFARAFEGIGRFTWRDEPGFRAWLAAIAEKIILEAVRKAKKQRKIRLESDVPGGDVSAGRALRREERFDRLQEALSSLSPEHRQVIVLARIERLKIAEVAVRMGRSPAAIKKLLSRALVKLREAFGDTESLSLPQRRIVEESSDDGV